MQLDNPRAMIGIAAAEAPQRCADPLSRAGRDLEKTGILGRIGREFDSWKDVDAFNLARRTESLYRHWSNGVGERFAEKRFAILREPLSVEDIRPRLPARSAATNGGEEPSEDRLRIVSTVELDPGLAQQCCVDYEIRHVSASARASFLSITAAPGRQAASLGRSPQLYCQLC